LDSIFLLILRKLKKGYNRVLPDVYFDEESDKNRFKIGLECSYQILSPSFSKILCPKRLTQILHFKKNSIFAKK